MKIKAVLVEIDTENELNELKAFIEGKKQTFPATDYANVIVPMLVKATISEPDQAIPNDAPVSQANTSDTKVAQSVPMIPQDRKGRPPVTQEWLIDKARHIHNATYMMKFFNKYSRFADRNGLSQWFRKLCDERLEEIRKASFPQLEATEPEILTEVLNEKDEAAIRQDIIEQIKHIKGSDYSVLDLFIDPQTGRIPYTEEARIPTDELSDKLDDMLTEMGGVADPNTEEEE